MTAGGIGASFEAEGLAFPGGPLLGTGEGLAQVQGELDLLEHAAEVPGGGIDVRRLMVVGGYEGFRQLRLSGVQEISSAHFCPNLCSRLALIQELE